MKVRREFGGFYFKLRNFRDRDLAARDFGQATVEYIFIVATVVAFAILIGKGLRPILQRIANAGIFDSLLIRGDLHRSPFR